MQSANATTATPYLTGFADAAEAELIERVIALRPLLRAEARKGDENRGITDTVYAALNEMEIWSLLMPRRWGGRALSCSAFSRINREIAKGDPSVAWVVQIINGTTWIGSLTSDRLQEELFGNGMVRICSSFATSGTAKPVDGGYTVDGDWTYNSGCRQSQWGQYLVNIVKPDGSAAPGNFVYVEMKDVEIIDTWFTAGLQGTSSDSARVRDLFVPEHRMVPATKGFSSHRATQKHTGEASDYYMIMPTIRSAGIGLQLGAAEAALDLAFETAQKRGVPSTSYARQAQSPVVQAKLGRATAMLHAAKLLMADCTTELDQIAIRREDPPLEVRAFNKARCSQAVDLITDAMTLIMFCAGSSAFLLDNPLQRFWRDINVAARHAIFNPDVGYEVFARVKLGVEPNIQPPPVI